MDLCFELDSDTVEWGGKVSGAVVIGARRPTQVRRVMVALQGIPLTGYSNSAPSYRTFRRNWNVDRTTPCRLCFELVVPWGVFGSPVPNLWARADWRERSSTSDAWSEERFGEARIGIRLAPPDDLQRLVQVVGEVTETQPQGWREGEGTVIIATFDPVDWQQRLFDEVSLEIRRKRQAKVGNAYTGHLLLNLRERSVSDQLRAAAGKDAARLDVRLQGADPDGVKKQLQERLQPSLDAARNLPLPASAPAVCRESLPRPAAGPELHNER